MRLTFTDMTSETVELIQFKILWHEKSSRSNKSLASSEFPIKLSYQNSYNSNPNNSKTNLNQNGCWVPSDIFGNVIGISATTKNPTHSFLEIIFLLLFWMKLISMEKETRFKLKTMSDRRIYFSWYQMFIF